MDNLERKKYRLYHSYKNERNLGWAIILSIFCLCINDGICLIIVVWVYYISSCKKNNNELNKDPLVLEQRKVFEDRDE